MDSFTEIICKYVLLLVRVSFVKLRYALQEVCVYMPASVVEVYACPKLKLVLKLVVATRMVYVFALQLVRIFVHSSVRFSINTQ